MEPLRCALIERLESQGELLLALNALREADQFSQSLHRARLRFGRRQAHGLIGRHAALKATGVAANPLLLLDLAGGLAFDSVLVMQLCQLYGLPMSGAGARELLVRLSGQNALLGGVQLGLQLVLSGLRQFLLIAAPFSAGLSLAPAAPVAIAQAATVAQMFAASSLVSGGPQKSSRMYAKAETARHEATRQRGAPLTW